MEKVKKPQIKLSDFKGHIVSLVNNEKWPSADGKIHHISDMTISHIVNTIAKIKREKWRLVYLPIFQKELARRIADAEFKLNNLKDNIGDAI